MEETLIKEVFKKAKKDSSRNSPNGLTTYLSETLAKSFKPGISQKTILRIHDQYLLGDETRITPPKIEYLHVFSQYLGYDNYEHFVADSDQSFTDYEVVGTIIPISRKEEEEEEERVHQNKETEKTEQAPNSQQNTYNNYGNGRQHVGDVNYFYRNKYSILITFFALFTLSVFLIIFFSKEDKFCMVWNENRYESVDCSKAINSDLPKVEFDSEELMQALMKLRKIEIDQNTPFFTENEKPLIWFSTLKDEYEFFNSSGKHPVTGEELKPVTLEILNNYFKIGNTNTIGDHSLNFNSEESEVTSEGNQNLGSFCFNNQENKSLTIEIQSTSLSEPLKKRIDVSIDEALCLNDLPVGNYTYIVYERNTKTLVQNGYFKVVEDLKRSLIIHPQVRGEFPEEKTTPDSKEVEISRCEKREIGDFCYANTSDEKIVVNINDQRNNSPLSSIGRTTYINPRSEGCIYDLPEGTYRGSIGRGKNYSDVQWFNFRIKRCTTSSLNPATIPEVSLTHCKEEKTGDFCMTNNSNKKIEVRINDINSSHMYTLFRTIHIPPNSTRCFYDVPEGPYNARIGKDNFEYVNFKITPCQVSNSEFR